METRMMDRSLLTLLLLLVGCSIGSCVYDKNFKFCGSWRHGNNTLTLNYDLSPGCENITVSANDSSLSVIGQITSQCTKSGSKSLKIDLVALWTVFCVHWEPLEDHLWLELPKQNFTLCEASGMQTCLCEYLSPEGGNRPDGVYGIGHTSIQGDPLEDKVLTAYVFLGEPINCREEPCDNASQRSNQVKITKIEIGSHVVGNVTLPKTNAIVVEMKENFHCFDFKAPFSELSLRCPST